MKLKALVAKCIHCLCTSPMFVTWICKIIFIFSLRSPQSLSLTVRSSQTFLSNDRKNFKFSGTNCVCILRFLINALFPIFIHLRLIADLLPDRGVLVSRSPSRGPFRSHRGIFSRLPVGEHLKIFDEYMAVVILLCDWLKYLVPQANLGFSCAGIF